MSGGRRVRSYRLVRLPWWVRAVAIGVLFGAGMFVIGWIGDNDSSVLGELVGAAISGLVVTIGVGLFMRAFERRLFDAGGRILTLDEQIVVLQAVDAGRWPKDRGLHPAVDRVAEQRLRLSGEPAFQIAVFILMIAVALVNVALNGPWWWCGVAFWAVVGPWSILRTNRSRAAALALREDGLVSGAARIGTETDNPFGAQREDGAH